MPDQIIDRDALIEKAARVLIEHDADRHTCYDHMGVCCPTEGCAHGFTSRTGHQAVEVVRLIVAEVLAPIEALMVGRDDWVHPIVHLSELRQAIADIRKAVGA